MFAHSRRTHVYCLEPRDTPCVFHSVVFSVCVARSVCTRATIRNNQDMVVVGLPMCRRLPWVTSVLSMNFMDAWGCVYRVTMHGGTSSHARDLVWLKGNFSAPRQLEFCKSNSCNKILSVTIDQSSLWALRQPAFRTSNHVSWLILTTSERHTYSTLTDSNNHQDTSHAVYYSCDSS